MTKENRLSCELHCLTTVSAIASTIFMKETPQRRKENFRRKLNTGLKLVKNTFKPSQLQEATSEEIKQSHVKLVKRKRTKEIFCE